MAKKKDTDKEETVTSKDVRQMITPVKLKSLIKSARTAQKDIQEIAGGLGAEIKAAVESNHLHRKAFSVCKTADKMEPEKLAEFLDNLDYYLDVSGLRKRAESAQRLAMGDDRHEEREEDEGGKGGKVTQFPQPHGVAAE